jgi:hypothetical protein
VKVREEPRASGIVKYSDLLGGTALATDDSSGAALSEVGQTVSSAAPARGRLFHRSSVSRTLLSPLAEVPYVIHAVPSGAT